MTDKFTHVRHAIATGEAGTHRCHWPGCDERMAPAAWGCRRHWFMLPKGLRNRIWRAYHPGQEATKTPSADYIVVAREAQDWIALHYPQDVAQAWRAAFTGLPDWSDLTTLDPDSYRKE